MFDQDKLLITVLACRDWTSRRAGSPMRSSVPVMPAQILSTSIWVGVKLLVLRPNQFFPQHRHPPSLAENYPGKEEIFRRQWGEAYLYVPG